MIVIVGAGQAGVQVAASLRQEGYTGRVVLVGDEPGVPYQRPPLSKAYIKDGDAARLALRAADFYAANAIELVAGRVVAIDRAAQEAALEGGTRLPYEHLVLATGSRNRRPPIPGADAPGVLDLRTLHDAERLRTALLAADRVAVVGGGFIGLEVAATAVALGKGTTVLEAAGRLMGRVVSPDTSRYLLEAHSAAGIDVRLEAPVAAVHAGGVTLADGGEVAGDLVLLAIGVGPNVELARAAGLEVADGIVVDDHLLTTDPLISAVGDCAAFTHAATGARTRLESVQNAIDHGRTVARRLAGRPAPYDAVPWFWSDQGAEKLQIAGLTAGAERFVARRGEGRLTVFALSGGHLAGVETVNAPADHMAARKLLAAPPTELALAAASWDLRTLMRSAG